MQSGRAPRKLPGAPSTTDTTGRQDASAGCRQVLGAKGQMAKPPEYGVCCMNRNGQQGRPADRRPERQCICCREFHVWKGLVELKLSPYSGLLPGRRRERKRTGGFLLTSFAHLPIPTPTGSLPHPTPASVHGSGGTLARNLALDPLMQWPLPHLQKVAECNYAESATGAISIRQTSVASFSLSKAFLLPNCSYRIIA